jgi:PEP-CTERM motif
MLRFSSLLCAAALGGFVASPASAAVLDFELVGAKSASFELNTTPPDFSSSSFIGNEVEYYNVAGTFNGTQQTASNISFGTFLIHDFEIDGTTLGFTQYGGPDLFSGSTTPIFSLGSFTVGTGEVLTISQVAAVPEPATWAMMVLGFMGVGFMAYRRKQNGPMLRMT